jgi:hypothetical protein
VFAANAKAVNLAWGIKATVYSEFISQTQPTMSVLSKYHLLGERLARTGLPLDVATSVIERGAIAIDAESRMYPDAGLSVRPAQEIRALLASGRAGVEAAA